MTPPRPLGEVVPPSTAGTKRQDAHPPVYWDTAGGGLHADTLPAGWRRHARDAHLELVARWVGSPTGTWLKTDLQEELSNARALIPRLAGHWIGIDLSHTVASAARRRGVVALVADVREPPFRAGAFDGVLSTSTLDHFDDADDIERSLRALCELLRPDGRLVLTLDNLQHPLIRLRNGLPPRLRRATGLADFHVGPTLSAAGAAACVGRTGFRVEEVEHLLHVPHIAGTRAARWPWFERRALPRFDRLGRTWIGPWTGHFVAVLAVPERAASVDP